MVLLAAVGAAQDLPGGACRLLENREISRVVSGRVVERKATGRTSGRLAISDCFYQVDPFVSSVSLELVGEIRGKRSEKGPRARWETLFHESKEEREDKAASRREKEDEKGAKPREIENVGDEAFWIANPVSGSLYVLKGNSYLRLSVGGGDSEAVKITRSVALARKALQRL